MVFVSNEFLKQKPQKWVIVIIAFILLILSQVSPWHLPRTRVSDPLHSTKTLDHIGRV